MKLAGYEIDDTIPLPPKSDYGIGIIGCGGIVNYAHLPAYRSRGLRVLACYDQNRAVAEETAQHHGIPGVADSIESMLDDPDIEIVDIAVTPWAQPDIAHKAIAAGKHLLCQKPFATSLEIATQIVDAADRAGVKLAVNQQMRWDAGIRVSKQLIDAGAIGSARDGRIEVSVQTPWHMWPWMAKQDRLEILYHSIHYQDSIRFLFGSPEFIYSTHQRQPGQVEAGETRTLTIFQYASELNIHIDVDHNNWSSDHFARFRFLGDRGIIAGTIGLLYDYPNGRVDSLRYQSNSEPREWHEASLSQRWIPDAFIGPMASLMSAIQTGEEPITSGRDNLGTLQSVFASYLSAERGRKVGFAELVP